MATRALLEPASTPTLLSRSCAWSVASVDAEPATCSSRFCVAVIVSMISSSLGPALTHPA